MAYGAPANPVSGTVITVAYARDNILDPIRWLRLLTGNADPPGSSYVCVSTSTSGVTWQKVPTDAIADHAVTAAKLAPGAAQANFPYTPANVAGDTFTGEVDVVANAGTGNNLRAMRLINTAGGNSGVYLQFISGPSNAMSLGMFVGNTLFDFLDVNGTGAFYLQSSDAQLYLYGQKLWHAGNLNPGAITVGDTALLNGQPGSYYRARANHTGTQLAATISDLAAAVATMAALSATTATTASIANSIADGAVSTTAKLANLVVTAAKIANTTITDAQVATANKDGGVGVASMRTLGPGAQQAAGGTHTHLANTTVATGNYSGNGSGPRAITSSLTFPPKIVHFQLTSGSYAVNHGYAFMSSVGKITIVPTGAATVDGNDGTLAPTGFSVAASLNVSGITYDWVAFGVGSMNEIEDFLREAGELRGISPDIVISVANTEGGTTEPARVGDFSGPPWYSGKSFWALQLHYGGENTPWAAWGGSAGMGNGFTKLTGWQPGDPAAWRDAARYGLNRARLGGWSPWYGAASIGVTGFMGIDRQHAFDPDSEVWDFERGTGAPLPTVIYDVTEPPHAQEGDWDCSQESAEWSLWSVGRKPSDAWMEQSMQDEAVVSQSLGLLDASGAGLAAWLNRHYGGPSDRYFAFNEDPVSFDELAQESGRYPMMIGGRAWGHWSGLRAYDVQRDLLLIANPSAGWRGVNQTLSRDQFDRLGSFSAVHLTHPDLIDPISDPSPSPPPNPVPPPPDAMVAQIESLQQQLAEANTKLGVASVDYARDLDGLARGVANVAEALRALHPPA